ncbi:MAG: ATP-binding protein [Candidatus Aenigmarchaeota archaeon]|nr:ATP-binding protein [Candidatus Aenigmarchaeota archaeon]
MRFQQFVNRNREIGFLEELYKENKSNLVILYGRRRVGKTELMTHFIKNKPGIYFLADSRTDISNLKELQREMGNYLDNELFKKAKIEDWFELFTEFTKLEKKKVIICIDEFPYLIDSNKAIPSVFQKIWDLILSKTNVFLILCGSSISMMEKHALNYKSPLYGRRTGQWKLQPMKFRHLSSFLSSYSKEDLVKVYSLTDGIPLYILELNQKLNFFDNLREKVFKPGRFLYQESEILLKQEFREPANYFSILNSIAYGRNKYGEICSFTNLDKSIVSKYLDNLNLLEIIKKEFPVTQKKEIRNAGYIFKDNYINFWFRFVYPNKSEIERGQNILKQIKKNFNSYLGFTFEKVCKEFLIENKSNLPFQFQKIGRWWHKDKEIDLVALNEEKKKILFVECKWKDLKEKKARKILEELKEKSKFVDWNLDNRKEFFGLVGKKVDSKTKKKLREEGYLIWDLKDF